MVPLTEISVLECLVDLGYATTRAAILRNRLAPGQHLSAPELARQLGVTWSAVREAVRLERDGLVQYIPHRGNVVAPPDAKELRELYEVRETLEGFTAGPAASRWTPSLFAANTKKAVMPHRYRGGVTLATTFQVAASHSVIDWAELDVRESPFEDPLLKEPFEVRNGVIATPERPGLGIHLDRSALTRHEVLAA